MRPEEGKTYGSPDVPHGKDSVIYAAAKFVEQELHLTLDVPKPVFAVQEVSDMVSARVSELQVLTALPEDYNGNTVDDVLEPTDEEVLKSGTTRETLITDRKLSLAQHQINYRISANLIVPELSDAFKAQFTINEDAQTLINK